MTDQNWIDFHLEKYYITQNRFKLFTSYDKDDTPMVTSLTEDICRHATEEIFLPVRHDLSTESTCYEYVVGGSFDYGCQAPAIIHTISPSPLRKRRFKYF